MMKTEMKRFNLNDFIVKLNKPAYMLIIIAYMAVLVLTVLIITPRKDFIYVPNYEHVNYHEDLQPQVTIVGIRSQDSDGNITPLRYSVTAKIPGRATEEKKDPKLPISRFQMSTYLTNNNMYYFTEQTDRTTNVSHSYTLYSTSTEILEPDTFFFKVYYKDINGVEKIATFKEDVMLEMPKVTYTSNNKITHKNSKNETVSDVELNFIAKKDEAESRYLLSVWVDVDDLSKRYHIDMQSWIVTEDGQTLPFIGVYGNTDQLSTLYISNREVGYKLKPKELYCHLSYHLIDEQGKITETKTINYKEAIANLPSQYGSNPNENPNPEPINTPKTFNWIPWAGGALAIVAASFITIYYFSKKRKKANKNA